MNKHILALLSIALVTSISANVYMVKLAKIQPHIHLVAIECYERKEVGYETTYNNGQPQSLQIAERSFHIENMDPAQALMLGCKELNPEIVDYSLLVCANNNRHLKTDFYIHLAQQAASSDTFWCKVTAGIFAVPSALGFMAGLANHDSIVCFLGCAIGSGSAAIAGGFYLYSMWLNRRCNRIVHALQNYGVGHYAN